MMIGLLAFLALGSSSDTPLFGTTFEQRIGVNVHRDHVRDGGLQRVRDLGLTWIRTDVFWDQIEKDDGWDFSYYDQLLADVDRLGLRALLILDYGHPRHAGPGMTTERARQGFAEYVRRTLTRYQGRGYVWELWNEPNHPRFWPPAPDPAQYAQLAAVVRNVFAEIAPDEPLIGPALNGIDMDYLVPAMRADALRGFRAISLHPYRAGAPESVLPELARVRQALDAGGLEGVPIVNSEWGYSTARGPINPMMQADYAARVFLVGSMAGFPLSIWYDLRNDGPDPNKFEHNFGLYDQAWNPKPPVETVKALTDALTGFTYDRRIALRAATDFCLLFRRGQDYRLVAWTTRTRPTQASLPTTARRVRVYNLGGTARERTPIGGAVSVTLNARPIVVEIDGPDLLLGALSAMPKLPVATTESPEAAVRSAVRAPALSGVVPTVDLAVGPGMELSTRASGTPSQVQGRVAAALTGLANAQVQRVRTSSTWLGIGTVAQETLWVPSPPLPAEPILGARGGLTVRVMNPLGLSGSVRVRARTEDHDREATATLDGGRFVDVPLGGAEMVRPVPTRMVVRGPGDRATERDLTVLWSETFDRPVGTTLADLGWNPLIDADTQGAVALEGRIVTAPEGLALRQALRLDYRLGMGPGYFELQPEIRAQALSGTPVVLGFWLYGDRSGHFMRIRYFDSTGQFFQPDMGPIDWLGWRYIRVPIDETAKGRWAGANDGIVHRPVTLRGVFMVEPARQGPRQGTWHLAGMTVYGVR